MICTYIHFERVCDTQYLHSNYLCWSIFKYALIWRINDLNAYMCIDTHALNIRVQYFANESLSLVVKLLPAIFHTQSKSRVAPARPHITQPKVASRSQNRAWTRDRGILKRLQLLRTTTKSHEMGKQGTFKYILSTIWFRDSWKLHNDIIFLLQRMNDERK